MLIWTNGALRHAPVLHQEGITDDAHDHHRMFALVGPFILTQPEHGARLCLPKEALVDLEAAQQQRPAYLTSAERIARTRRAQVDSNESFPRDFFQKASRVSLDGRAVVVEVS